MTGSGRPQEHALAIERTVLAWSRTALVLVGLAALLVRFGEREHVEAAAYAVAAVAVGTAAIFWRSSRAAFANGAAPLVGFAGIRLFATVVALISLGTAGTVLAGLL